MPHGKCSCLSVCRKLEKYKIPFKLVAETQDNKVVEANGVIDVANTVKLNSHVEDVDLDAKCPYEV